MLKAPREYNKHLEKAADLEEREIYIDAISEYEAAIEYNPDNYKLYANIANDYLKIDNSSKYISYMTKAINVGGEDAKSALDELLKYYKDNNQDQKALNFIKEYAENHPDYKYAQESYIKLKGSYKQLYCYYDEMFGMYNDYMVVKSGDMYSMLDAEGSRVLDVKYKELAPYSIDGYAMTVNDKGRTIYIDTDGLTRIVLDKKYSKLGMAMNDVIAASSGGKYGYISYSGKELTGLKWDGLTAYNSVGAAKQGNKWALISKQGKEITEFIFDDVVVDDNNVACHQSRVFVKSDGKYQMINKKGEVLDDTKYDDAHAFNKDGCAAVCKNGKWGFVNADGELVIDYTYENARSFSNGYAAVCIDDRWGYIDEEGNLIIPATFLDATDFSSAKTAAIHVALDEEDSEWQLIKLF